MRDGKILIKDKLLADLLAMGLNEGDISRLTGYSVSTVLQYLTGARSSELFERKIADLLKITYATFVERYYV